MPQYSSSEKSPKLVLLQLRLDRIPRRNPVQSKPWTGPLWGLEITSRDARIGMNVRYAAIRVTALGILDPVWIAIASLVVV